MTHPAPAWQHPLVPPAVEVRKQQRYVDLRSKGWGQAAAAREVGVSVTWANKFDGLSKNINGNNRTRNPHLDDEATLPAPIPFEELAGNPLRGWEDFGFFREYYLGHVATPWQSRAANRAVELLTSPDKEFVVLNCPPGAGKSTFATDFGTWVTVRDRSLRGLMGSRLANNGRRQVTRVRRNLERTVVLKAKSEDIAKGVGLDARSTIAADYGIFKPLAHTDVWRAEEFVVVQHDEAPIEEKEPTWSSYGVDSGVLGNRFDLIFWDDLVDKTNTRTFDAQEALQRTWDDELETRLEPGGLLILIGQRMASTDLYHYCLGKTLGGDDEDDDGEVPVVPDEEVSAPLEQQYHHIVYPAHDEEICPGRQHRSAEQKPWPDGCLLDPIRLPWRDLRVIKANNPSSYEILYQQRVGTAESFFIRDEWLTGGSDPDDGTLRPGCYDTDRSLLELPAGLTPPFHSIATVDPSVTNYWAIQWWIYAPNAGEQVFLMDLVDRSMPANDLLDWNANAGDWYGVMHEWQERSVQLGLPITHWVVEINAAHRYLLAYDHMRRWQRKWGVNIVPHTTSRTKLDEDIGPDIIRDHFRNGRARIPRSQDPETRIATNRYIEQLRNYRRMKRDDQVMATWFLFANLPTIAPKRNLQRRQHRPSWLTRSA